MSLKHTPLYEKHVENGGKMIEFGGWEMPVWYTSLIEEHKMIREKVGLFDVSHMGEIWVLGEDAQKFVDYLITNNVSKISENEIVYSLMCYENGGIVDDLLAYKYNENKYLLVVNASNIEKDYEWIKKNSSDFEVKVINASEDFGQIAIQGPMTEEILKEHVEYNIENIPFYTFTETKVFGKECILSRTGYTGEDGFEIYLKASDAPYMWDNLLKISKEVGGAPAGLGCRDSLRFEAVYMLYGHEINKDTIPLEAGLKWAVDLEKDFIGKKAVADYKEKGFTRRLRGIEILSKVPVRQGYEIFDTEDKKIGFVTTGLKSISTDRNLALGYIDEGYNKFGNKVKIEVRGKKIDAEIIKTPFYRGSVKSKKK